MPSIHNDVHCTWPRFIISDRNGEARRAEGEESTKRIHELNMNINDNVKERKSSGRGWRGQQVETGGGFKVQRVMITV